MELFRVAELYVRLYAFHSNKPKSRVWAIWVKTMMGIISDIHTPITVEVTYSRQRSRA